MPSKNKPLAKSEQAAYEAERDLARSCCSQYAK